MRVQHNVTALNSYRQLGANNANSSKNLEKLSSGYRINRAGDDAAGLAVSEKMRSQIRGLETAQKNAQDGISLIQTAEGALTEVHSMLNRMVELAGLSANGTIQDADRENYHSEVEALKKEIDRIAQGTNFNGINLLDGSLSGGTTISGNKINTGTVMKYGDVTLTGTLEPFKATGITGIDFTESDVLTIDGKDITIDWGKHLSTIDQDAISGAAGKATAGTADETAAAAKMIEDAINAAIDESGTGVAHVKVGVDDGGTKLTVTSGSKKGDSEVTIKTLGTDSLAAKILGTAGATAAAKSQTVSFTVADDSIFQMEVGGETIAVKTSDEITAGSTTMAEVASQLQTDMQTALTALNDKLMGTSSGTAPYNVNDITVEVGKDGNFTITNKTGADISFSDLDGKSFAETLGLTSTSGAVSGKGLTLQIGDTAAKFNQITVSVDDMSSASLGIASIDVGKQETSQAAIDAVNAAIVKVSTNRGNLGALQNRLDHTINNLGVTTENLVEAESRIRDTDMAKEMMDFTKNSILMQSAQAMLAQANQLPQGVLQLLR